ncbi:MAG: hypothetical protein J1F35_03885 [Erysipelotrichales bacterium]|nr:hypothetical protein [Erysipelotrichales bacterium]
MKEELMAIIEIGSNNTKTHIYDDDKVVYEHLATIEFKKNYKLEGKILESDLESLYKEIETALSYTNNVNIYGCSIFRNITSEELNEINNTLEEKFNLSITVVSQEEEAEYTALGAYGNIDYDGNICVFIGGGGSTELIIVNNKKIIDKKYLDFGVVDITSHFPDLKEDIATVSFDDAYSYVYSLIGEFNPQCDIMILSGGNHPYWYQNAEFELLDNTLYKCANQPSMLTIEMSDKYDREALKISLDKVRSNSDNPPWFDGSRAMKIITNVISHRINAKYIIPTNINMEDGIRNKLLNKED